MCHFLSPIRLCSAQDQTAKCLSAATAAEPDSLTCCVSLGKLLNLSVPWFPFINGNISTHLKVLRELNESFM